MNLVKERQDDHEKITLKGFTRRISQEKAKAAVMAMAETIINLTTGGRKRSFNKMVMVMRIGA